MKQMKQILLILCCAGVMRAQIVIGFESLNPAPNSAYTSTSSTPFQVSGVSFNHVYNFGYWLEGFSYTNKYNSTDSTYTNEHGVMAYLGNSQSAVYTVGQKRAVITPPAQATVTGLYVTNTTYAYKVIRSGNQFARKFGDTTGTGSGTTIPQGQYPDYFKLIVRAWKAGVQKPDSVTFFLADYRSSNDYIVGDWQFVNTAPLGSADSLIFTLRSSDNGQFGMNTPNYFAIDDVRLELPNPVSVLNRAANVLHAWPQPFSNSISVRVEGDCTLRLFDLNGRVVSEADGSTIHAPEGLDAGAYLLEIGAQGLTQRVKVMKQ
jgi:hypothetical protein